MKQNIVALIPLRGGSKSIPLKNIKIMAGKPLCYWSIRAAAECPKISRVFVSTESAQIKAVVNSFNFKKVSVIDRPINLATDRASTESVMTHAATTVDYDMMVTLQATSPLTRSSDLEKAIKLFEGKGYDSLLTAVITKRFFWGWDNKPLNYQPVKRPRRQNFKGTLMENGAFYITKKEVLKKYKNRLGGKTGIYVMDSEHAVELDEPGDWPTVENALIDREIKPLLKNIKLIVTDFDGVLTNNMVELDQNGRESVVCNRSDGLAVGLFKKKGIKIICLSSEKNMIVTQRCKKLNLPVYQGHENKLVVLKKYLFANKYKKEQCLYIGNDLNDLGCLNYVGFPVIPKDAADYLKTFNYFMVNASGGQGVLREVYKLNFE